MKAMSDLHIMGVLGGMGPLASAAFVSTFYRAFQGRSEQDTPILLLYSNPSIEDRTTALLHPESTTELLHDLESGLCHLTGQGATHLVMCCITAHCLVDKLAGPLKQKIISLVDRIVVELLSRDDRSLLVCTTGTRQSQVFQSHPDWPLIKHRIALPNHADQEAIHKSIYRVKKDHCLDDICGLLRSLLPAYGANSIIAGCTELHLMSSPWIGSQHLLQGIHVIDPLSRIAEDWNEHFTNRLDLDSPFRGSMPPLSPTRLSSCRVIDPATDVSR